MFKCCNSLIQRANFSGVSIRNTTAASQTNIIFTKNVNQFLDKNYITTQKKYPYISIKPVKFSANCCGTKWSRRTCLWHIFPIAQRAHHMFNGTDTWRSQFISCGSTSIFTGFAASVFVTFNVTIEQFIVFFSLKVAPNPFTCTLIHRAEVSPPDWLFTTLCNMLNRPLQHGKMVDFPNKN